MASEICGSAGGFKAGRRWLSWALAAALVALAFTFVDLNKAYEAFFAMPLSYLVIGVVLCLADRALMALRWYLLIRGLGGRVDFLSVGVASLKSNVISVLVHSIAGDFTKIAYMKGRLDIHSIIIPSLVADRVIGLISMIPLGICGVIYLSLAVKDDLQLDEALHMTMISAAALLMIIVIYHAVKSRGALCQKAIFKPISKWVDSLQGSCKWVSGYGLYFCLLY